MSELLPLRRLWVIYKQILATTPFSSPRDRVIAQHSFYAGAQATIKVFEQMLEERDYEGLHKTIRRHARRIEAIQRRAPPERRH
jgi:hypothetical protein